MPSGNREESSVSTGLDLSVAWCSVAVSWKPKSEHSTRIRSQRQKASDSCWCDRDAGGTLGLACGREASLPETTNPQPRRCPVCRTTCAGLGHSRRVPIAPMPCLAEQTRAGRRVTAIVAVLRSLHQMCHRNRPQVSCWKLRISEPVGNAAIIGEKSWHA